ncbi:hypothetical protein ABVT39_022513 [Epinephelus coioides]
MKIDGTQLVVVKELRRKKKIHLENSTAMSLSRNHDPFTQDHPQTLLLAVSYKNYCLSTNLHPPAVSLYRRTRESAASSPSTIALANVKAQEASPQEVHQALKPIFVVAK